MNTPTQRVRQALYDTVDFLIRDGHESCTPKLLADISSLHVSTVLNRLRSLAVPFIATEVPGKRLFRLVDVKKALEGYDA